MGWHAMALRGKGQEWVRASVDLHVNSCTFLPRDAMHPRYCNSALGAGECPRAATTTGDDEQSQ